jgi:SAM-dependent methyltransferase
MACAAGRGVVLQLESDISERISPGPGEISEAMEPYVVRRLSVHSDEWRAHHQKELKEWRRRLWRRRFRRLSFKLKPQQQGVREKYSSGWMKTDWPSPGDTAQPESFYDWHEEGLRLKTSGLKRVHQRLLWRCMKEFRPRSVLEVGFGNGLNLLALSTAFPGVRWAGVELSPGGVARAKEAQAEAELLPAISAFCSWPNEAPQAYRNVDFREGDARRLPFDDRSFDLVFSLLALEQMEEIRDAAVAELARVSAKWVAMIEPFADFNRDPLRRACTRAKGFFSLRVHELARFGLEPIFVFDDMPQKITRGAGLVLARKR